MAYPVSLNILGNNLYINFSALFSHTIWKREGARLLSGIPHPQRSLMVACSKQWL